MANAIIHSENYALDRNQTSLDSQTISSHRWAGAITGLAICSLYLLSIHQYWPFRFLHLVQISDALHQSSLILPGVGWPVSPLAASLLGVLFPLSLALIGQLVAKIHTVPFLTQRIVHRYLRITGSLLIMLCLFQAFLTIFIER